MDIMKHLDSLEERYRELGKLLSVPETVKDPVRFVPLSKEYRELKELVSEYRRFQKITKSLEEDEEIIKTSRDKDLIEVAKTESETLKREKEESLHQLQVLLVPKDPLDEKSIIVEIRAGVGGEEAALFAKDLRSEERRVGKEC